MKLEHEDYYSGYVFDIEESIITGNIVIKDSVIFKDKQFAIKNIKEQFPELRTPEENTELFKKKYKKILAKAKDKFNKNISNMSEEEIKLGKKVRNLYKFSSKKGKINEQ